MHSEKPTPVTYSPPAPGGDGRSLLRLYSGRQPVAGGVPRTRPAVTCNCSAANQPITAGSSRCSSARMRAARVSVVSSSSTGTAAWAMIGPGVHVLR